MIRINDHFNTNLAAMPFTVDMAMYMPLPNVDLLGLTGRSIEDDRLQIFGLVENFFAR